jgi:hypothetical protein
VFVTHDENSELEGKKQVTLVVSLAFASSPVVLSHKYGCGAITYVTPVNGQDHSSHFLDASERRASWRC